MITTYDVIMESDFEEFLIDEYSGLSKKYKQKITDFMQDLYRDGVRWCNFNDITDFLQNIECKTKKDITIIEDLIDRLFTDEFISYIILDCEGLFCFK